VVVVACGDGGEATPTPDAGPPNPLAPPSPEEGVQFAFDIEAPAQTEIWKCLVGPIPGIDGGGFLPFNRVVSKQSPGVHHMDLALLTQTSLEPGVYDCKELYDAHPELMDEIIIYASQSAEQQLTLPEGIVANVPAALNTMLEVHYVNTADAPVSVFTRINAYWIDAADVKGEIWGQAIRDRTLDIPAGGSADEWTRCTMTQDIDLLVVSTHTHALGVKTEVYLWDGAQRGELIYTNEDWMTPLLMDLTAAPIKVKAGQGFEFHCKYQNTGDKDVHWGFGAADEMCNLALVYTPGLQSITCEKVETSDGVLVDP
jgi:hypothetical protein